MTESEARKKWCPFVRVSFLTPDGIETCHTNEKFCTSRQEAGNHCIASDCMAWRWHSYKHNPPLVSDPTEPTDGYCGLGAKP